MRAKSDAEAESALKSTSVAAEAKAADPTILRAPATYLTLKSDAAAAVAREITPDAEKEVLEQLVDKLHVG